MSDGYILLADDNATDAELTIRALEIGGVGEQVVWVQDGEAALHFVFRKGVYAQRAPGNPCVMLLDLHMPKIDGLEVLAQIKGDPRTRSTPVDHHVVLGPGIGHDAQLCSATRTAISSSRSTSSSSPSRSRCSGSTGPASTVRDRDEP